MFNVRELGKRQCFKIKWLIKHTIRFGSIQHSITSMDKIIYPEKGVQKMNGWKGLKVWEELYTVFII